MPSFTLTLARPNGSDGQSHLIFLLGEACSACERTFDFSAFARRMASGSS